MGLSLPPRKPRYHFTARLSSTELVNLIGPDFAHFGEVQPFAAHLHAHDHATAVWLVMKLNETTVVSGSFDASPSSYKSFRIKSMSSLFAALRFNTSHILFAKSRWSVEISFLPNFFKASVLHRRHQRVLLHAYLYLQLPFEFACKHHFPYPSHLHPYQHLQFL